MKAKRGQGFKGPRIQVEDPRQAPLLKIKQKLHYRKVGRNDPKTCWQCGHRKLIDIHSCAVFHNGESTILKKDYRCEVLGLKNSIHYAIRTGHVCDRFAYFPIEKKYYAEKF